MNTEQLRETCTKQRHEDRKGLARREGGHRESVGRGQETLANVTKVYKKETKSQKTTGQFNALNVPTFLPCSASLYSSHPGLPISFLSCIYANLGMSYKDVELWEYDLLLIIL